MLSYIKLFFIIIYATIISILAMICSLDRSFNLYNLLSKVFAKGIFLISGVRVTISGLENIDPNGTYVLVSNHSSQFDIPAIQWTSPVRTSFLYKKEINKVPIFGWQLMMGPYVTIDRKNAEKAMQGIQKAKELMSRKNVSVVVFAEGTRSKTGEIQQFKRGAFYLASKVGFPIVPVTITGTSQILPKGKFMIKSGTINVHYDKPIDTTFLKTRQDEISLMDKVREIVISNYR